MTNKSRIIGYNVKVYTVDDSQDTTCRSEFMSPQAYESLREKIDQGKSDVRIMSVEPVFDGFTCFNLKDIHGILQCNEELHKAYISDALFKTAVDTLVYTNGITVERLLIVILRLCNICKESQDRLTRLTMNSHSRLFQMEGDKT